MPELASRAHVQAIAPVVNRALADAGVAVRDLDGIAVTAAPGLVGALLVGVMYGKTLAWSLDLPAHRRAPSRGSPVRGDARGPDRVTAVRGAAGERRAHDAARRAGVGAVPAAGPDDRRCRRRGVRQGGEAARARLSRRPADRAPRARGTRRHGSGFPRPMLREMDRPGAQQYAFSFSGLKTAVLRAVQQSNDLDADRADLALAFQDAALDVLVEKTAHAVDALGYETVVIGGGVACNRALAARMRARVAPARVAVASPTAQHRQCRDDRGRRRVAARARRTQRLGPRAARYPAPPRPHRHHLRRKPRHEHLSVHDPPRQLRHHRLRADDDVRLPGGRLDHAGRPARARTQRGLLRRHHRGGSDRRHRRRQALVRRAHARSRRAVHPRRPGVVRRVPGRRDRRPAHGRAAQGAGALDDAAGGTGARGRRTPWGGSAAS